MTPDRSWVTRLISCFLPLLCSLICYWAFWTSLTRSCSSSLVSRSARSCRCSWSEGGTQYLPPHLRLWGPHQLSWRPLMNWSTLTTSTPSPWRRWAAGSAATRRARQWRRLTRLPLTLRRWWSRMRPSASRTSLRRWSSPAVTVTVRWMTFSLEPPPLPSVAWIRKPAWRTPTATPDTKGPLPLSATCPLPCAPRAPGTTCSPMNSSPSLLVSESNP